MPLTDTRPRRSGRRFFRRTENATYMPRKPKSPTAEQIKAKLAELDALRKKLKAAVGGPGAKKKKKPRFSGSWGLGECQRPPNDRI
jgi:hypothetical protein